MTRMIVNGQPLAFDLDPQTPLLHALREAANITSPKKGCEDGSCHACTVLVDGRAVPSCTLTIGRAEGTQVVTVEGLPPDHPLFAAWVEAQPTMCGYCDPGFICALAGLLSVNVAPSADVLVSLPNRCPCGAGPRIARAAGIAAASLRASAEREERRTREPAQFSLGSSRLVDDDGEQ